MGVGVCMSKCTCVFVSGVMIVNRYLAELITTDAGRFGHVGLCQLHTKRPACRPAAMCTKLKIHVRPVTNGAK